MKVQNTRGDLPCLRCLGCSLLLIGIGCGSGDADCSQTATCQPATLDDAGSDARVDHAAPMISEGSPAAETGSNVDVSSGADGDAGGNSADVAKTDGAEAGPCGVDAPCYVDDPSAIFVSPQGSDSTGTGTKGAPFRSITRAVAGGAGTSKHVFACDNGTGYPESIVLNDASGVQALYGGFDCTNWMYNSKAQAKVAPAAPGYALTLTGLKAAITIENFEFDSKDAVVAGASSIAVWIAQSTSVVFRRGAIAAGAGRDGATSSPASNYDHVVVSPTDPVVFGFNATSLAPGPTRECLLLCTDGHYSTGGMGSGPSASPGGYGLPMITPPMPAFATGKPGAWVQQMSECTADKVASPGSAAPAASGGPGASRWGHLSAGGWAPEPGTAGSTGGAGQGGGGAGGLGTGFGGSGGCGGCGGAGGPAGSGAGSSFAVLVLDSQVTVSESVLVVRTAGNGGPGGAGQVGQMGGNGGLGVGCSDAAPGGTGGPGGGGGGGAGGLSVGIGYQGTAPVLIGGTTVMLPNVVATGGAPGSAANQNPGTKGKDGVAQNTLLLP